MVSLSARNVVKWTPLCLFVILLSFRLASAEDKCVLLDEKKITGGCLKNEVNILFAEKKFEADLKLERGMRAKKLAINIDFGGCTIKFTTDSDNSDTFRLTPEGGNPLAFINTAILRCSDSSIDVRNLDLTSVYTKSCNPQFKKQGDKFSLATKFILDSTDDVVYLQFNGGGTQFEVPQKGDSKSADGAMMIAGVVWWGWLLIALLVLLLLSSLIGLLIYCCIFRKTRRTVSDQSQVISRSTSNTPVEKDANKVPTSVVVSEPKSIVKPEPKSVVKSKSIRTVKSNMGETPKTTTKGDVTRSVTIDDENFLGDGNLVRTDDQKQDKSVQIQGF